jgi:ankyrin repeat protein
MSQTPSSPILDALYRGQRAEAEALAAETGSHKLTVHEAAALGEVARLEQLIDSDPSAVNAWSSDGFQPLALACFFGRQAAAERLLQRGAELDTPARHPFHVTALHAALASPNPDFALSLLAARAAVNVQQQGGVTPLHQAAHLGRLDLVQALLDHGADATAVDDQGRSAIDLTGERDHQAIVDLLRRAVSAKV